MNHQVESSSRYLDLSDSGVKKLCECADQHSKAYSKNIPFPHVVIDNLFPESLLRDVKQDVIGMNHEVEKKFYGSTKKITSADPWSMGLTARLSC